MVHGWTWVTGGLLQVSGWRSVVNFHFHVSITKWFKTGCYRNKTELNMQCADITFFLAWWCIQSHFLVRCLHTNITYAKLCLCSFCYFVIMCTLFVSGYVFSLFLFPLMNMQLSWVVCLFSLFLYMHFFFYLWYQCFWFPSGILWYIYTRWELCISDSWMLVCVRGYVLVKYMAFTDWETTFVLLQKSFHFDFWRQCVTVTQC